MQRVHVEVKVRQRQGFTRFQHEMAMAVQFVGHKLTNDHNI